MRHTDATPALFRTAPHNGTPTSIAAAKSVRATVAQQRGEVYRCIKGAVGGLTDEEGYALSGISPNAWRPRRGELVRDRLVVDSGSTRATASGRQAVVWVAAKHHASEKGNP